eukprot:38571-Prymnesium_polylepis.1
MSVPTQEVAAMRRSLAVLELTNQLRAVNEQLSRLGIAPPAPSSRHQQPPTPAPPTQPTQPTQPPTPTPPLYEPGQALLPATGLEDPTGLIKITLEAGVFYRKCMWELHGASPAGLSKQQKATCTQLLT